MPLPVQTVVSVGRGRATPTEVGHTSHCCHRGIGQALLVTVARYHVFWVRLPWLKCRARFTTHNTVGAAYSVEEYHVIVPG